MKKLVIVMLALIFMGALFAEVEKNIQTKRGISTPQYLNKSVTGNRNLPPDVSIAYAPVQLMFSYNDYFMGGYNSIPIRMQSNNYGIYMTYHGQETSQSASRKVYYNYVQGGQNANSGRITSGDLHQGFPSLALDPETHDPFIAWHGIITTGFDPAIVISYDQYHLFNTPNMWSIPQVVIDNENNPDTFMWPNVFVGDSPLGADYHRLYVYGTDSAVQEIPFELIKLAYTDYTAEMLNGNTPFVWSYRNIPQLDEWVNTTNNTIRRPQFSFFCEGAKVGFMGFIIMDSLSTAEPDLFVLYNDNYGEGDFTLAMENSERYVSNPMNYFTTTDSLYFAPINSNNFNVAMDHAGNLHMINCWGLRSGGGYYWNYQYVKDVQFDFNTSQFKILDIEPKGAEDSNYYEYEHDDQIYLPWDENNDGVIDEIGNNNGTPCPVIKSDFPFYWWNFEDSYSENNFRIVSSPDNSVLVAVWQNSNKSRQFNELENPDFSEYANVPEMVVEISGNNGTMWTHPYYFNSIDTPEVFGGMIPEYIYPCDTVEILDNNGQFTVRVHFMFYNDLSYGSFVRGNGENIGGYMSYMALDFMPVSNSDNVAEVTHLLKQN